MNILFIFSNSEKWTFFSQFEVIDNKFDETLPEVSFTESMIQKDVSGQIEIMKYNDSDISDDDCVCIISDITTSDSCSYYIFHLFAYLKEGKISCEQFFGFNARYNHGVLFEYYLLLVERYFELLAAEQAAIGDEPNRLLNLSESDEEEFEEMKKQAKLLLNMLSLASLQFRENADILPKLYRVIDLFMKQFPDAFFLALLANFTEREIESLYLDDEIYTGMQSLCNKYSFHNKRMFQTLETFKHFPISSYFTSERLSYTFISLLTTYCGEYSAQELRTAILNVTAFVMQKLPNKAAMGVINQILIGLEMQSETFQFILEAILVIEKENLGKLLEAPQFPIDTEESLKRLSDYLGGDFVEKHKYYCKDVQTKYPRDKLKIFLKEISEKSFVAGIIFVRLFNNSYIKRGRKLTDAFDAVVSGRIQSVIEHSKILRDCKEAPVELQRQLRFLNGRFPERILNLSGCGNKTTISAALEHLRISRQKIHEDRQAEWRKGGVALHRWESRFDKDDSEFPKYQRLTRELEQIDALISELQKLSGSMLLKDVLDKNNKDIERVNAEIKVFDDQKHRIMQEYQRLRKEAKKSILDRLFGA